MLNSIFAALLPFLVFFGNGPGLLLNNINQKTRDANTGTLEKMIVANGSVTIDLDLNHLNGNTKNSGLSALRFDVERDSFFQIVVFNDELRGAVSGSMKLIPQNSAALPAALNDAHHRLVIEKTAWGEPYELAVRDSQTGFLFFNIEGLLYDYNANQDLLDVRLGRVLLSKEFAAAIGNESEEGTVVGQISLAAALRPVEVSQVVFGEVVSTDMPAGDSEFGRVPGPDVIVGDLIGLQQFGSSFGTQVGLAVGTDSCNAGNVDLNWFQNPNNDHPVIPQNLYRMSGGADNTQKFEQIGQSSVKHAFTALTQNLCGFGCNGVGGSRLGVGCSDPYSASLNAGPNLGSRAWINPFTGFYPRNDSATPNNNHAGHTHNGPTHRILTEINDLNTTLNPGATYYAEGQYVTPHEYAWCQANPTQCNMFNNVSYRRYNVSGTGSPFSFSPAGSTVRTQPAINAWTGSTRVEFRPDPINDGIGTVAYKVTNPSPGVWHYEYAVYNMNIDRAIQSFSVPVGSGATLSSIGFHAPPQHPGSSNDGTVGSAGFSSTPWAQNQAANSMTWSTETFAQNPNANAIRWGTMYNFRFDSNRPPQTATATIGFFKTGAPITVQVQAPSANVTANVSVTGRVTTATGRPIFNARVFITDSGGVTRMAITNPFGYYGFYSVTPGGSYTMAVESKRHTFTPRVLQVNGNLQDVDFTALP